MSTLDKLKVTNRLAILCVLLVAALVVAYALEIIGLLHADLDACLGVELGEGRKQCRGQTHLAIMNMDTVKTLTVYIFAFTCHQNIFGRSPSPCGVFAFDCFSWMRWPTMRASADCAVVVSSVFALQVCVTSSRISLSLVAMQSYVRPYLSLWRLTRNYSCSRISPG